MRSPSAALKSFAIIAGVASASPAFAALPTNGTATGTLGVQMKIEAGCNLTNAGATTSSGALPNAVLDFGTLPSGSTGLVDGVVNASASTSGGGSLIEISCSSAYVAANAPYLDFGAGLNASGTQRRMSGPAGSFAPYNLYKDAGRNVPWVAGTPVQLVIPTANQATPVYVYGRVPNVSGLADGTYTDTVQMTLYY